MQSQYSWRRTRIPLGCTINAIRRVLMVPSSYLSSSLHVTSARSCQNSKFGSISDETASVLCTLSFFHPKPNSPASRCMKRFRYSQHQIHKQSSFICLCQFFAFRDTIRCNVPEGPLSQRNIFNSTIFIRIRTQTSARNRTRLRYVFIDILLYIGSFTSRTRSRTREHKPPKFYSYFHVVSNHQF